MRIEDCTRCDSKIVEDHGSRIRPISITRDVGENGYETQDAYLCSMCWDDLWAWAFGEDTPDRSDMADPQPLDRMAESVERHIEDLEGILETVENAKGGE